MELLCLPASISVFYNTHGHCLQKSVVYQAHVTTAKKTMIYTGMTKNSFKQRWCVHNSTIEKRPTKEKVTTLSEYIWKLKDQKIPFKVTWSIKSKAYAFSSGSKRCDLCTIDNVSFLPGVSDQTIDSRV